jgi:putative flippase GtrA
VPVLPRSIVLHRNHRFHQVARFALVGGSGVAVNTVAFILIVKVLPYDVHSPAFALYPTPYNVRWLHVVSFLSFLIANVWNFEFNRIWTFKHSGVVERTRFGHFFTVGLAAQFVGFFILTALTHPGSPLRLPADVFDDSTGLRTMAYWAQLIMIIVTTPLSFLLNKLWTFKHDHLEDDLDHAERESHLPPPVTRESDWRGSAR